MSIGHPGTDPDSGLATPDRTPDIEPGTRADTHPARNPGTEADSTAAITAASREPAPLMHGALRCPIRAGHHGARTGQNAMHYRASGACGPTSAGRHQ